MIRRIGITITRMAMLSGRMRHSPNWQRTPFSKRKSKNTYTSGILSSRLWQPLATRWGYDECPGSGIAIDFMQGGVKGYTITAFDWLLENEYPLLLLLFIEGMIPYGYGNVRQVPVVSTFARYWPYLNVISCVADIHASVLHAGHSTFLRRSANGLHNWWVSWIITTLTLV